MANQTNDYTSHHTQNNKIKRTVEHILTWLGCIASISCNHVLSS